MSISNAITRRKCNKRTKFNSGNDKILRASHGAMHKIAVTEAVPAIKKTIKKAAIWFWLSVAVDLHFMWFRCVNE